MFHRLNTPIKDSIPGFTRTLVEGFHQKEFEGAIHYYRRSLKLIFRNLDKRGVYFDDVEDVAPHEYIEHLLKSSAKVFEIPKESLYPVRLGFRYKDKSGVIHNMGPVYTMLPHTNEYGDYFLRGAHYNLQYVMTDQGLPVAKDNSLFVKVLGFKFKIGIEHFNYNQVFTETGNIIVRTQGINLAANRFYTPTESRKIKDNKTPTPLLAWYIFANMGFTRAMETYGECEFQIGDVDTLISECKPKERWEIFTRSSSQNPRFLGDYVDNEYAIAVRNKSINRKELNTTAMQYAQALLFVMDCMSSYFDEFRINDPEYWELLIGRTSVKAGDSNESIMRLMKDHFDSMNEYLDEDSIKKFASQSIVVSDMYELFNYIITNRSEIVQTTDRASGFHKELASLEFILDRLITAANNFKHVIKNNSDLSYKKVAKFLNDCFHIKEIDSSQYANVILEPTPTDNPFLDFGLGVIPQAKVYTGVGKKKRGDFDTTDSACFTHASLPFVYSFLHVTSPYPDGRGYLNPCIYLINERITALHPKHKALYDRTTHRLKFRMPT